MTDFWETLIPPWQVCLEQAWTAYCGDSLPIGAAITDSAGFLLATGRSRRHEPHSTGGYVSASRLAHAELNALIQLPAEHPDRHEWILYTTTEPCPLCIGALYMTGLRRLRYASRDPWAGSVNLLGTTPYMRRKPILVNGPVHEDLEAIVVAMGVEAMLRQRLVKADQVLQAYHEAMPRKTSFGEFLFGKKTLTSMHADNASPPLVFNHLAQLWSLQR
jgi:tRNA(Arg) A34 adenosine deaminase TadA